MNVNTFFEFFKSRNHLYSVLNENELFYLDNIGLIYYLNT